MVTWAMLLSIALAGVLSALLMRRSASWKRAILVSTVVSLGISATLSLWFGWETGSSDTDPVIGLVLYGFGPAVAIASTVGVAYAIGRARQECDAQASSPGLFAVIAWGAVLAVGCTMIALSGFQRAFGYALSAPI